MLALQLICMQDGQATSPAVTMGLQRLDWLPTKPMDVLEIQEGTLTTSQTPLLTTWMWEEVEHDKYGALGCICKLCGKLKI